MAASTNAINIRDAVFSRAVQVVPQGYPNGWETARTVSVPTVVVTALPLLQVIIARELLSPDNEDNTGAVKFKVEMTLAITTKRAIEDPVVLEGEADQDLAAILDAVLQDNTFTNPELQSGFVWEGISKIDTVRGQEEAAIETYSYNTTVNITFTYRLEFAPPTPYWLEEVVTTIQDPKTKETLGQAIAEVGQINYAVVGPSSGMVGAPSGQFTVRLESGASFTGNQSVTIIDGGAGGVFSTSDGSGVGSVVVTPPNGAVYFSFIYNPAQAGEITFTFYNAQDWNDPEPFTFSASS